MHSITSTQNNYLLFNSPSDKDYTLIKQLFKTKFYQYVKSKWIIDDIINENFLLPFDKSSLSNHLEFNYTIKNKEQHLVGYIKGYYHLSSYSLWIQILAINKPFIRRGYGRSIIRNLILLLLEDNSIQYIYLTCHNLNIIGIHFWESLGFTKIYNIKSTHSLYKADLRSLSCIPNHLKP